MGAHIPDERGHVVLPDGWCTECEAWHPDTPESARRHSYPPNAQDGLDALPIGQMFIGANRYNTDDTATLHLWTEDGRSFDVRWPLPNWRCPCTAAAVVGEPGKAGNE